MNSRPLPVALVSVCVIASHAAAAPAIEATYYRSDEPFPEFARFWSDEAAAVAEGSAEFSSALRRATSLGGSLHLFVRNDGPGALVIDDVLLQDISLRRAIAFSDQRKERKPAHVVFSDLDDAQKAALAAAGDPIWWRVDPAPIPPAGLGEITIRLRTPPRIPAPSVEIRFGGNSLRSEIRVVDGPPRIESIGFAPDLRTMYLYIRHSKAPGVRPGRVTMDGHEVTSAIRFAADPKVSVVAGVLGLDPAPAPGSFHVLTVTWPDQTAAACGIRAWAPAFGYGVWGGPGGGEDPRIARRYVTELAALNVNLQMPQVGSPAASSFYKSQPGQKLCRKLGLGFVLSDPGKWGIRDPYALFLHDEPDAGDAHIAGLPPGREVGSLAQWAVDRSTRWRQEAPDRPQMLNVDLTYKPQNWYVYGQLPDILLADPYYQPTLRTAFYQAPERMALYSRATFVRAVSTVVRSAAAPKPTHVILYANRYIHQPPRPGSRADRPERKPVRDGDFRYPTPQEKRIEAYYAVAAGAKGLSYWWYTPGRPAHGLGGQGDDAAALRREVGVIGAELRTLGPLIERSCPAEVPCGSPREAMVRCLLAGTDAMIVLVFNEQYRSDHVGTTIIPLEDVAIDLYVPPWMRPCKAFEVGTGGTTDVRTRTSGDRLIIHLGRLDLPRAIVLAADAHIRAQLQSLYAERFAASAAALRSGASPGP